MTIKCFLNTIFTLQTLQNIFDLSSTLIRFELKCVVLDTEEDPTSGAALLKREIEKGRLISKQIHILLVY